MNIVKIGTLVCATSLIAGCGGSEKQLLLGPGATEAEAIAAIDALETEVNDVFLADGVTEYAALPGGTVSYTGLIFGDANGGPIGNTGPDINYAADLELTVNFVDDGVMGRASNFVTSVADFGNPTGTILLTGDVSDGGPDAEISFNGIGVLTGTNGVTAEYDVSAGGAFGGTDGNVLAGFQETDFDWLTGADAGTTSYSDAGFGAIQD